jgi:hypothetical protein
VRVGLGTAVGTSVIVPPGESGSTVGAALVGVGNGTLGVGVSSSPPHPARARERQAMRNMRFMVGGSDMREQEIDPYRGVLPQETPDEPRWAVEGVLPHTALLVR